MYRLDAQIKSRLEITSKPKLQQMLHFYLGNEETSLKWEFPGKGKTDIIIERNPSLLLTTLEMKWQKCIVIMEHGIMLLNLSDIVPEGMFRNFVLVCVWRVFD